MTDRTQESLAARGPATAASGLDGAGRAGEWAVVVTNDDGIDSVGLWRLAAAATAAGHEVVVAAPDYEASGTSAIMTATWDGGRIMVEPRKLPGLDGTTAYAMPAAPAFIAASAARGAFGDRPHLLLSGINRGLNTGLDILHSGTAGAAMTAATYGVPAAAFSLQIAGSGTPYWETAEAVAAQVIPAVPDLPAGTILNVNIPSLPLDQLRGIRVGRLAPPWTALASLTQISEYGTAEPEAAEQLQLTMSRTRGGPESGSDIALLAAGYASITVVRPLCEVTLPTLPWPPAD
jgi:5'-nucleotidase